MNTKRITTEIAQAADAIRAGQLVAVPTETVYGLAGNGLDPDAVAQIYEVKGRPAVKPLSLMVHDVSAMARYCADVPPAAYTLAEAFWPGPLTIVLRAQDCVPEIVRAGGETVGLRCPDHPATLTLIEAAQLPLAAPSANPSGAPSPKTADDVLAYFDGQIAAVIDGGPCGIGRESTLVDLSHTPYRILRSAAVADDAVWDALVQKMHIVGITGEALNIVIGSMPYAGEGRDRVKLAVLSLLNDEYGITEEDFLSAELAAVPAFPARDIGFDRSMIGAYGQDDRVCAYAELRAILDLDGAPERTAVCILADKEEIGSDGVSGMQSQAFEAFMADLCEQQDVALRHCFAKSFCLSADVCAAFDPSYPEVSAKRTEAKLNYGMGICKFTGARGKSGTSDASAELVAYLRRLFADNGVVWQLSEMGKVDQGGGGTIAKFMADRNIDTIDAGVPVLSMHSPFELVAKFDCWMTYRGVLAAYCDTQE